MTDAETLDQLLTRARACRICAKALAHDPRPVVKMAASSRLLIIGQAPGTKVHASGIPWNDPSGDRLRGWLQMDRDAFYDVNRVAIMPMGFCFPGQDAKGGDLPPRKECAPAWHAPLLAHLPNVKFTLLVGSYAQAHYLGRRRKATMTETVRSYAEYLPDRMLPLPHPSWRNTGWMKKNPWFEADVLPALRSILTQCGFKTSA